MFLDQLNKVDPSWTNATKPLAQNWMFLPAGLSAASYAVVFSKDGPRVEIYFTSSNTEANKTNFDKVLAFKSGIESAFGADLLWDRLDDKKAARISYSRTGELENEQDWNEYVTWFVDNIVRLRQAVDSVGGLTALLN